MNFRGIRTQFLYAYISSGHVYGSSNCISLFFTSLESAEALNWVSCRICAIGVLFEKTMWKFLWDFSFIILIFSGWYVPPIESGTR